MKNQFSVGLTETSDITEWVISLLSFDQWDKLMAIVKTAYYFVTV